MNHPPLYPAVRCAAASFLIGLLPALVAAQAGPGQDPAGMSLEDLLAVEVVSAASKFSQSVHEAPASVTVITAEEIRRFGHRTLADTLKGVRGFYTTYDRNYAYIGVRGFARPGDYNTRVLLLVDGHRLNDGIYDMAQMGTDFPIDMSLVERIEVIRGPSSSLYGTNALFAVINVITKTGASHSGVRVSAQGGSLGTGRAAASYGRVFGDGRELLVAGTAYRSDGQRRLYFEEFRDAGPSQGVALNLDRDEAISLLGTMSAGRFSVRAGAAHRDKQVPTASFGTVFGDDREVTIDDRAFVSGVYDGRLGRGWMGTARLAYDYYGYQGDYPTDYGEAGIVVFEDQSAVHSVTGELTARRRFGRAHLLTAGAEARRDLHNRQIARDNSGQYLDVNVPGTNVGVYVQDEFRPVSWLLLNAGLRVDRFSAFGSRATPRAGLVLLPRRQTAIKLLHGRAFRAPNPYERYYYTARPERGLQLRPEQIQSSELVWEETLSKHVRLTLTAFSYDVQQIIEQRATGEGDLFFENAGRIRGSGFEAEAEARFDNGASARVSHTFARVRDHERDVAVSNSPRHLSTVSLQAPVSRLVVAVEGQYVGERFTLGGAPLAGFFAPNVTVTTRARGRLWFGVSLYNVFNRAYADPGAEEHLQPSIRQDGRTVLARMHVAF